MKLLLLLIRINVFFLHIFVTRKEKDMVRSSLFLRCVAVSAYMACWTYSIKKKKNECRIGMEQCKDTFVVVWEEAILSPHLVHSCGGMSRSLREPR